MIDAFGLLGAVGSPADLATLVVVLGVLRRRLRWMAAGIVANAQENTHVDDDRLQAELGVGEDVVDAVRPVVVCGGEEEGGSR